MVFVRKWWKATLKDILQAIASKNNNNKGFHIFKRCLGLKLKETQNTIIRLVDTFLKLWLAFKRGAPISTLLNLLLHYLQGEFTDRFYFLTIASISFCIWVCKWDNKLINE